MGKKGFTLIEVMIVAVIIAILAMTAVAMYQRYLERTRNSAAQSVLQQVAVAEAASQVEAEADASDPQSYIFFSTNVDTDQVKKLTDLGFRPDPQIGLAVLPLKSGLPGFVAFAAHRSSHSLMHVYNDIAFDGVRPFKPGLALGVDIPAELPIFIMSGSSAIAIVSTEKVRVDVATGLVISSGP